MSHPLTRQLAVQASRRNRDCHRKPPSGRLIGQIILQFQLIKKSLVGSDIQIRLVKLLSFSRKISQVSSEIQFSQVDECSLLLVDIDQFFIQFQFQVDQLIVQFSVIIILSVNLVAQFTVQFQQINTFYVQFKYIDQILVQFSRLAYHLI